MDEKSKKSHDVVTDHRRQWQDCQYVYPVISRRAKGVSVGVNLNIDKRCSFSCMYCQINRKLRREPMKVEIPKLKDELELTLCTIGNGKLWEVERFAETPPEMRRINDIAFSGDGEPTALPNFDEAVIAAVDGLAKYRQANPQDKTADQIKIVIITNASHLQSPQFARALPVLDANNGEIWAKLDAGTEEFFRKVNRPAAGLTLENILANILAVSKDRPVVIQTLFFRIDGLAPTEAEIDAYCQRLNWIIKNNGMIKNVQLHTIARPPSASNASTLQDENLDAIAEIVREKISPVPVDVYYGRNVEPQ